MLFITIVAFIVILSVLVIIHELGHFILAKKFGVKVEEFGFGFPPRLIGKKIGETLYSINLLPVGGFVKLYGEDAAGGGQVKSSKLPVRQAQGKQVKSHDLKRAFFARSAKQRAAIVLAGVVMNFLLAVVLISFLFATQGVLLPTKNIRVVEVLTDGPSFVSGIKKDDIILSLNSHPVQKTEDFISQTRLRMGEQVTVRIKRGEKILAIMLIPRKVFPKGEGPLGISITNIEVKKYSLIQAPFFGTLEAFKFSYLIGKGLFDMVFNLVLHGQKPTGIAGPVGVAQLTGQAVSYGLGATLWFVALLSLNLAVLNVLPIPALDGGRLFFILIELVTGKKVNQKYEAYAHAIGLIALLGLIVLVTVLDVLRILSGRSILQP